MTQYIDKSALVAELKRQISAIDNSPKITDTQISVLEGNKVVLTKLLSFIDALEVKEVDLDTEIMKYQREIYDRDTTVRDVAKYFFELGLKAAQKRE